MALANPNPCFVCTRKGLDCRGGKKVGEVPPHFTGPPVSTGGEKKQPRHGQRPTPSSSIYSGMYGTRASPSAKGRTVEPWRDPYVFSPCTGFFNVFAYFMTTSTLRWGGCAKVRGVRSSIQIFCTDKRGSDRSDACIFFLLVRTYTLRRRLILLLPLLVRESCHEKAPEMPLTTAVLLYFTSLHNIFVPLL